MEFERWATQGILKPEGKLKFWATPTPEQLLPLHIWDQLTAPHDHATAPDHPVWSALKDINTVAHAAPGPFADGNQPLPMAPSVLGGATASEAAKFAWIRSQIPGRAMEFVTPLGTKRLLTYADHTASSQPLMHVENIIAQQVLPLYGNTHTEDSEVGKSTTQAVEQAGEFLKRCLGGTQDEALFLCGSGTTAALKKLQECIGVTVPHFLRSRVRRLLNLEERWVVLLGPYEHHSNLLSWRESLAEVVEIPMDEDGCGLDMAKLKAVLENPKYAERPKLGCFSAASNVTGLITDTRAISRLLHDHGAFACFDFAASGPHVRIDMRAGTIDGYDAVVLSPHKFLGGPGSCGILLMSKDLYLLKDSPPSTCGGGTVDYVNGFRSEETLYIDDIEHREDAGTPAILQKLRAALAFWVKELVGHDLIESREHYFITTAMKRLQDNPCIRILGNTQAKRCAILSFVVYSKELQERGDGEQQKLAIVVGHNRRATWKPRHSDWHRHEPRTIRKGKVLNSRFVVKLLNDLFGIQARAGCACAGPYGHYLLGVDHERSLALRKAIKQGFSVVKPGFARLSFCYYMSNEEFEFILSAVEFVAEHGQRFLPLYEINWKTGEWTCKPKVGLWVMAEPYKSPRPLLETGPVKSPHYESTFSSGDATHLAMELSNLSVANNYRTYLDAAQVMASFLEEFPPEGRIPTYIDAALIDFRV